MKMKQMYLQKKMSARKTAQMTVLKTAPKKHWCLQKTEPVSQKADSRLFLMNSPKSFQEQKIQMFPMKNPSELYPSRFLSVQE